MNTQNLSDKPCNNAISIEAYLETLSNLPTTEHKICINICDTYSKHNLNDENNEVNIDLNGEYTYIVANNNNEAYDELEKIFCPTNQNENLTILNNSNEDTKEKWYYNKQKRIVLILSTTQDNQFNNYLFAYYKNNCIAIDLITYEEFNDKPWYSNYTIFTYFNNSSLKVRDIYSELEKVNFVCGPKANLTVNVCNNDNLKGTYIGPYIGPYITEDSINFIVASFGYNCEFDYDEGLFSSLVRENSILFYNPAKNLMLIIYDGVGEGVYGGSDIVDACTGDTQINNPVLSSETETPNEDEDTIFNQFEINLVNDTPSDITVLDLVSEIEKVSNLCNGFCPEDKQSALNIEVNSYYNNNRFYFNKNFNGKYDYIGSGDVDSELFDYINETYGNPCGDQVQLQSLRQLKSKKQTKKNRNVIDNNVNESNNNSVEDTGVSKPTYWFYNNENNLILQILLDNDGDTPNAYNKYRGYAFIDLCNDNDILDDDQLSYLCSLSDEERYVEGEKTIFQNFEITTAFDTPCDINKTQLRQVLLSIYRENESVDGIVEDSMDKICINVCKEFSIDINGGEYNYDGEYTLIGVVTSDEGYNYYVEYLGELCDSGDSFAAKKLKSRQDSETYADLIFYSKDQDAILYFHIENEDIDYYQLYSTICAATAPTTPIDSDELDLDFSKG